MLTAERLREMLDYNPLTGVFYWRINRKGGAFAGQKAGRAHRQGYIRIGVDGREHAAARLAWLYMTGEWPENEVDHRDCNGLNNAWRNLRPASRRQNCKNVRTKRNSKIGLKGVQRTDSIVPSFGATICCDGRRIWLGTFDTPEKAHEAYKKAAEIYHGEFARAG